MIPVVGGGTSTSLHQPREVATRAKQMTGTRQTVLNVPHHSGISGGDRPAAETERVPVEARASERLSPPQGLEAVRKGVWQGTRGASAHHRDARERQGESEGKGGAGRGHGSSWYIPCLWAEGKPTFWGTSFAFGFFLLLSEDRGTGGGGGAGASRAGRLQAYDAPKTTPQASNQRLISSGTRYPFSRLFVPNTAAATNKHSRLLLNVAAPNRGSLSTYACG